MELMWSKAFALVIQSVFLSFYYIYCVNENKFWWLKSLEKLTSGLALLSNWTLWCLSWTPPPTSTQKKKRKKMHTIFSDGLSSLKCVQRTLWMQNINLCILFLQTLKGLYPALPLHVPRSTLKSFLSLEVAIQQWVVTVTNVLWISLMCILWILVLKINIVAFAG